MHLRAGSSWRPTGRCADRGGGRGSAAAPRARIRPGSGTRLPLRHGCRAGSRGFRRPRGRDYLAHTVRPDQVDHCRAEPEVVDGVLDDLLQRLVQVQAGGNTPADGGQVHRLLSPRGILLLSTRPGWTATVIMLGRPAPA